MIAWLQSSGTIVARNDYAGRIVTTTKQTSTHFNGVHVGRVDAGTVEFDQCFASAGEREGNFMDVNTSGEWFRTEKSRPC